MPEKMRVISIEPSWRSWVAPWYIAYGIMGAIYLGLVPILLPLFTSSSVGAAEIGLVMASMNLGLMSSPLWGYLAARYQRYRELFFLGFLLVGVSLPAFIFTRFLLSWVVLAFILGLGAAASNTVASLFVVEFYPRTEWNQRISWLQTFNRVGQVCGLTLAGPLSHGYFETGLIASALLVPPALYFGRKGLPGPAKRFHLPHVNFSDLELRQIVRRAELFSGAFFHHVHRPTLERLKKFNSVFETHFGRLLVGWFMISISAAAFFSLYPLLMSNNYGIKPSAASLIYASSAGLSVLLYNTTGSWSNRIGSSRVLLTGVSARFVAFLALLLLALPHSSPAAWMAAIFFALMVLTWPLLIVTGTDLSAELSNMNVGAAMGLFIASGAAARVIGALLGGFLASTTGYWTIPAVAALSVGLCWALVLSLPRRTELKPNDASSH